DIEWHLRQPLLKSRRAGNLAVFRFDDDRTMELTADRPTATFVEILRGLGGRCAILLARLDDLLDLRRLLGGNDQRRESRGSHEGRQVPVLPTPLKIPPPVREARCSIAIALGEGRQ